MDTVFCQNSPKKLSLLWLTLKKIPVLSNGEQVVVEFALLEMTTPLRKSLIESKVERIDPELISH